MHFPIFFLEIFGCIFFLSFTSSEETTAASRTSPPVGVNVECSSLNNTHGIAYWPSVKGNQISRGTCPDGFNGSAEWLCTASGVFDPAGPRITCSSLAWLKEYQKQIANSTNVEDIKAIVESVNDNLLNTKLQFAEELNQVFSMTETVVTSSRETHSTHSSHSSHSSHSGEIGEPEGPEVPEATNVPENPDGPEYPDDPENPEFPKNRNRKTVAESILASYSILLDQTDAWKNANSKQIQEFVSHILHSIQYSSFLLACTDYDKDGGHDFHREIFVNSSSNIVLNQFNFDSVHSKIRFLHISSGLEFVGNYWETFTGTVSPVCDHKIAMGSVISKLSNTINMVDKRDDHKRLNSEIVGFTMNNASKSVPLGKNNRVKVRLLHHERLRFGSNIECVFWDFDTETWKQDGCNQVWSESTLFSTTCECDHVTNFAILLDTSGEEHSSTGKTILTYFFSILTILLLSLVFFGYLFFPKYRNKREIIIMNLSGSLVGLHLLVLVGSEQTQVPGLCKVISVLTLFALFSSFTWMSLQGFNIYKIASSQQNGKMSSKRTLNIGYGLPSVLTLLVVLWITVAEQDLTNEYFCWIASSRHPTQIWLVASIICIPVIYNVYILCYCIYSSYHKIKNVHTLPSTNTGIWNIFKRNEKPEKRIKVHLDRPVEDNGVVIISLACISYSFVTGMIWASFTTYVNSANTAFSYVFISLTGLQGIFIFTIEFVKYKSIILNSIGIFGQSIDTSRATQSTTLQTN